MKRKIGTAHIPNNINILNLVLALFFAVLFIIAIMGIFRYGDKYLYAGAAVFLIASLGFFKNVKTY